MPLRVRILSQGDEIVSGATLDTNARWLAEGLWSRGAQVLGIASAPDDLAALERLFVDAGRDADLVVVTGGLGPTDDDLSAEAAARAAGVELAESAEALEQVRERFRSLSRPMSPSNVKQALLPRDAEVLLNPAGTAPGFALALGRARFFFFPGVPRELYVMAELHLWPWAEAHGLKPPQRRRLHVCGLGESALQDRLRGLSVPPGIRLGFKTWLPYNTVLLYADPDSPAATAGFALACEQVRGRLQDEVFGEDDTTLPEALGAQLQARGWTLALAESCTAGLASALVTEVAGSSSWFRGGIVSYADQAKTDLLGVPPALLARHGAVSEEVARAMAAGARRSLGADVGAAITGIAGPGGGSEEKPVGLVCFALEAEAGSEARTVRFADRGRDVVRSLAAAHALEWLRRRLAAGISGGSASPR